MAANPKENPYDMLYDSHLFEIAFLKACQYNFFFEQGVVGLTDSQLFLTTAKKLV